MAVKFMVGRVVFETIEAAEIFNQRVLSVLNADEGDIPEDEFIEMADHVAAEMYPGPGTIEARVLRHHAARFQTNPVPEKPIR